MEKILYIVNPVAGGGKTKELVPLIESTMKHRNIEYSIVFTTKPKEGTDLAKEGLNEGYTLIVAVGGDGTVNEVAYGIIETGRGILGILPSGTGNDLARSLGISLNPKEALETILEGKTKNIDIGKANDNLFLNISSIGFDAEVVIVTDRIKTKIKSSISYVIALLITIFRFKCIRVEMEIDGLTIKDNILLIAVGNGKYYGGGIKILPMSNVEDGYFHVCTVKKISKLKLLFLLPTIVNGSHINQRKYVNIYKARNIKVRTMEKSYLNVDGEIEEINGEVIFEMNSSKLRVTAND
ncbi:MAG TPA: diacylglycerol kinase family lipid kinase [Tissierellia bacterium]|nr:diacylglycerol kinase family lipid kinase [Tissierellia bacterium]